MSDVVLAIDAGGTKLLGGLVTGDGAVLGATRWRLRAPPRAAIPDCGRWPRWPPGWRTRRRPPGTGSSASGVGFPEYVRDGAVTSAEVFAWDRQPADVLADVVPGVPVTVEADVLCAAAAEAHARSAARDRACSTCRGAPASPRRWSSTVCRCRGRRGEALALGEWPVAAAVDPGWKGNLEQYAAGLSLGRRYTELDRQRSSMAAA